MSWNSFVFTSEFVVVSGFVRLKVLASLKSTIVRSLISAQLSSDELDKGPNRVGSYCDVREGAGQQKGTGRLPTLRGIFWAAARAISTLRHRSEYEKLEQPHWHLHVPYDTANDCKIDALEPRDWEHMRQRFSYTLYWRKCLKIRLTLVSKALLWFIHNVFFLFEASFYSKVLGTSIRKFGNPRHLRRKSVWLFMT